MINNWYFLNSFFTDHLILINFSAIFAYIVHKSNLDNCIWEEYREAIQKEN